nr:hypothetical protein [uncultured Cupriavidus sp.]
MHTEALAALAATLERAEVTELTYREGSEVLTLRFAGTTAPAPGEPARQEPSFAPSASPDASRLDILANATGSFSRTHPLTDESPAEQVTQGEHVGYLAVESVLSAITAPTDGRAAEQLAEDGKTVGYGQALVALIAA